jgi:hypothetical protein
MRDKSTKEPLVSMLGDKTPWRRVWHDLTKGAASELPLKALIWSHGGSRHRIWQRDATGQIRWVASSPLLRDWTLEHQHPVMHTAARLLPPGNRAAVIVCRDQALSYSDNPQTWKQITRPVQGRPTLQEGPLVIPAKNWTVPQVPRADQPPPNITLLPIARDQLPSYFRQQHQHFDPASRTVTDLGNTGSRYRTPRPQTSASAPHLRHFYGRYLPNFLPKAPGASQWQD